MKDSTDPDHTDETAELELRKLRAETRQAERNTTFTERAEFREWVKTIAIIGAAMATLIKVITEL